MAISRVVRDRDPAIKDGPVRLIDVDNEQLGIVSLEEARAKAAERNLDLVLVSEQASPPVCRIMNFGRFQYEKKRQLKNQRKKQQAQKNKEIKFHANIDPHDYDFKVNHIREFLNKGCRVKVSLFFRGREMARRNVGVELMNKVIEELGDVATVDSPPKLVGRNVNMLLIPGAAASVNTKKS